MASLSLQLILCLPAPTCGNTIVIFISHCLRWIYIKNDSARSSQLQKSAYLGFHHGLRGTNKFGLKTNCERSLNNLQIPNWTRGLKHYLPAPLFIIRSVLLKAVFIERPSNEVFSLLMQKYLRQCKRVLRLQKASVEVELMRRRGVNHAWRHSGHDWPWFHITQGFFPQKR
jgi:hypothetical protein